MRIEKECLVVTYLLRVTPKEASLIKACVGKVLPEGEWFDTAKAIYGVMEDIGVHNDAKRDLHSGSLEFRVL